MGSDEIVIGFQFVGVPGTVVRTPEEARAAFAAVTTEGKVRVLILTEQVSAMIPTEVMGWQVGGAYPLVVEIPDVSGHLEGRTSLIDSIRQAVGLHV
jgi:vacuolar-type H+-ATPase subunit F/Vma7